MGRTRAGGRLLPRIGAHVGTSGGLPAILERAHHLRAETIQFFSSNPRTWRPTTYPPDQIADFRAAVATERLPVFLHTIYLVNPASPDEALRARSATAIAQALAFGAEAGAAGVVTHVGSHRGDGFAPALARTVAALGQAHALAARILEERALELPLPPLLLETSAGQANSMGRTPGELGQLLRPLETPTGVCLDTAHLFAAGYDLRSPAGIEAFLEELDEHVGSQHVGLVHFNDARRPLGSHVDQHENLGQGTLGAGGMAHFLTHPALQQVPFVLEVPGFDGHGPDRRNLGRARRWRRDGAPL